MKHHYEKNLLKQKQCATQIKCRSFTVMLKMQVLSMLEIEILLIQNLSILYINPIKSCSKKQKQKQQKAF
jgi:hypothetical protein